MNYRIPILALSGALGLTACVTHTHMLLPQKAVSGRLQHASDGTGTMELAYSGKSYAGTFEAEPSRRIHGEHQRHPGRIARTALFASDGDSLSCDVQWTRGRDPAGTCKGKTGTSFEVRFD